MTATTNAEELSITIDNPWARPLPEVAKNGAVYLVISNHGSEVDQILGGSSPVADRVELHAQVHKDGLVKMEKQAFVEVPAKGKAVFEPGGLHVMLVGLTVPMTEGTEFPLVLELEKSGKIEVNVLVTEMRGEGMDHSGHMQQTD